MRKNVIEKLMHAKEIYLPSQFILFASVGVIGTAGHYIVLVLLVQLGNMMPFYASTLGFCVGALINYFLNYKYTFQCQKNHFEAMVKFFAVALIGASINGVIMLIGTESLKVNYLLIQVLATGIVVFLTYFLNILWTFPEKKA